MSGNRYFFFDEKSLRRFLCRFNAEYKNLLQECEPSEPVTRKRTDMKPSHASKGKELVPGAHSVAEFCAVFGMDRRTVYSMRQQGKIKTLKVGNRRLIPDHEFKKYRDELNRNRPLPLVEALDIALDYAEGNSAICLCFRGPRGNRATAAAFIARQLLSETVGDTLPALKGSEYAS